MINSNSLFSNSKFKLFFPHFNMLFTLVVACIRKLLVEVVSFFISYMKLVKVNYTCKGVLKKLLHKLQFLLIETDGLYSNLYKLCDYKLPLRYEVPNFEHTLQILEYGGSSLEKGNCFLKLNADIHMYLDTCDIVNEIISENETYYDRISSNVLATIDQELFKFMMNVLAYETRKQALLYMSSDRHDLSVHIFFTTSIHSADCFYNDLSNAKKRMRRLEKVDF